MSEVPATYQIAYDKEENSAPPLYTTKDNQNWMGIDNSDHVSRIIGFNVHAGKESIKRDLNDPVVQGAINLVDEEYAETKTAYSENDREEVVDGLCDLIVVCVGALFDMGVSPTEAMNRVCTANESKFCLTEGDAILSVKKYDSDERYSDVKYEMYSSPLNEEIKFYVITGKTTKGKWKILKPHFWTAPNLSDIL